MVMMHENIPTVQFSWTTEAVSMLLNHCLKLVSSVLCATSFL